MSILPSKIGCHIVAKLWRSTEEFALPVRLPPLYCPLFLLPLIIFDQYLFFLLVLPYEEMVLRAAKLPDNPDAARIVHAELINVIATEQRMLTELRQIGVTQYVDISHQPYRYDRH